MKHPNHNKAVQALNRLATHMNVGEVNILVTVAEGLVRAREPVGERVWWFRNVLHGTWHWRRESENKSPCGRADAGLRGQYKDPGSAYCYRCADAIEKVEE